MRIEEFFKPRQACGLSLIQMVSKPIKTKNPQIGATWYGLVRIGQFDIVLNTHSMHYISAIMGKRQCYNYFGH